MSNFIFFLQNGGLVEEYKKNPNPKDKFIFTIFW